MSKGSEETARRSLGPSSDEPLTCVANVLVVGDSALMSTSSHHGPCSR